MKKARFSGCLAVVLGISSSIALIADAAAEVSGVIRFTGAIVEGSCEVTHEHSRVNAYCLRNGQGITSQHTVEQVATAPQKLPVSFGTSQLNWVDAARQHGILVISYN